MGDNEVNIHFVFAVVFVVIDSQIEVRTRTLGLLRDGDRLRCIMRAIHKLGDGTHEALIRGSFKRTGMLDGRVTPEQLKVSAFDIGRPHRDKNLPDVTAELLQQLFANRHLIQQVGTAVMKNDFCYDYRFFSFLLFDFL